MLVGTHNPDGTQEKMMMHLPQYPIELNKLEELHYCINCIDEGTRLTGTFAYSHELAEMGFGMWAISPVFSSVDIFYKWAKATGFPYHSNSKSFVLSRVFS